MDSFTENILARARERQKMLKGYTSGEKTPLREANTDIKTNSEPNLTEVKKAYRKEVVSEPDISTKTENSDDAFKENNNSESNLTRFTRQNSKTRVSSEINGSPKAQLKTLNIQKENFNMEIKVSSKDNIRVEVEIEEQDDSESGSHTSESGLRDDSKNKLKRLGKLYAGGDEADISSPIHKTEAKFYANEENEGNTKKLKPASGSGSNIRKGLRGLADLAQTINQWEDESGPSRPEKQTGSRRKTWKPPAPTPPVVSSPPKSSPSKPSQKPKAPDPPVLKKDSPAKNVADVKENTSSSPVKLHSSPKKVGSDANGVVPKQLKWDQKVLDTLESQGFTRTSSSSRLVYSYNSQDKNASADVKTAHTTHVVKASDELKHDTILEEEEEPVKENKVKEATCAIEERNTSCPKSPVKTGSQLNGKEKPVPKSPSKTNIRTANIANKAAIFESSPSRNTRDPALLSVSERKALFEKNRGDALVPKAAFAMSAPVKVETTMKASSTKIITDENVKPSLIVNKQQTDSNKAVSVASKQVNSNKISSTVENVKTIVHTPAKAGKYLATKPPVEDKVVERNSPTIAAVHQAGGIASKMAALLQNKSTISQAQIENNIKEQRQKEMDMLLNRFHKNKEVSNDVIQTVQEEESDDEIDATEETAMITEKSARIVKPGEKRKSGDKPYNKGDSPIVTSVLDEVKRIKVSPPKAGRLYPNLSDIEATNTETDTRTPSPDNNSRTKKLPNPTTPSNYSVHSHCFSKKAQNNIKSKACFEENNYESDDPNTSFGREILQAVCKNQTPQKRPIYDESTASDISSILDDMDNYLVELSNDENTSSGPTPPKQVRPAPLEKTSTQPSNSFNYKNYSPSVNNTPKSKFQSPVKIKTSPRKSTDLPTYVVEGDNVLPLTHTVSFYRKQQNQASTPVTPVRQISRQPLIEEHPTEVSENQEVVQKKIAELQEEVNKQQNIISQTSQALNLCSSTPEFSGSTEQVEAERVLLVATHRRQAALHELQRLRVEGTLRPQGQHAQHVPLEKGTLTISHIVLPLKQKYVKALAAAGGKGHHVVCLVKCGEQVVPTKLVSTVVANAKNPDVDLSIPGTVTLNNIYSDFTVTFEVYCLQAQEEFLPHDIKYHINNKKSGNKLVTPKKSRQESRMVMPIKESPAGPHAVRTSSFALMGYVVFSVQAVNRRVWSLNNTPSMSPLDGSVEMRICCELAVSVEHRGFLTMFEDVSGFGAWHRRWCLLKGHTLSYWKYPDDEKKMAPIDTIDLKNCITKQVGPVSREICARLHTFLLERERPAHPQDKDSLVTVCKGDKTVIRHLLSADTKEERIEWCTKFNAALTALRMWGNTQ